MALRDQNLDGLSDGVLDVLIVGGGINGAVSAACLAARGARVGLIDRGDFACTTSQASSNLAWGGIKYMESYDFGLVWKLCGSRNELLRAYPSAVREARFFLVHEASFRRGRLLLWLGTWLYWLLGRFFTKPPRLLSNVDLAADEPAVERAGTDGGIEYSDAFLPDNDARFVFGFVRAAMNRGALAANYVESMGARQDDNGVWNVDLVDRETNRVFQARARVLLNAGGPYADVHNGLSGVSTRHRHVFSKGIHLVVPRITNSGRVLAFFADDGRPFFVIPMGPCTCIGTTDTPVDEPTNVVSEEDRAFVLDNINKRLALSSPLTKDDIIAERCGVRPLAVSGASGEGRDWMELSRKHVVEVSHEASHISIYGGKLTDCLNVGEEVAEAVASLGVVLPKPFTRWYGEPTADVRAELERRAAAAGLAHRAMPVTGETLPARLLRRYGEDALPIIDAMRDDPRRAEVLIEGTDHTLGELEAIRAREMIVRLEDFLRRRSKIALVVPRAELYRSEGLKRAAHILFGDRAEEQLDLYFRNA